MLLYLIDRVGAPTFIWSLVTYMAWQSRALANLSVIYGIVAVTSAWYLNLLVKAVNCELKLARLGARAPSYRTWTPYNLGFIYSAVMHMLSHRNHEFWWKIFDKARASNASGEQWTAETVLMGERIIFTADEENMKAVLATQFGSYGKGPQFRKEWKDFLGLSTSMF